MKKAVIYSRVSTLEQDYTSQTAELKKEAERMGYEVTHIYEEKESGFVDDRPELAKVLALTNADTDAVFVWGISRLSRRTVMVLSTIEDIEKKGILIYAKNENYRSWNEKGVKDSTSKLVLTLYASIAEAEALKFKERVKRGKRYRVLVEKKSYCNTSVFGYMKDENGRLVINEEEAEIVRDIFNKALEGYSGRRLKLYLKSKWGLDWSANTLNYLLHNTAYMGQKKVGGKTYYKAEKKKLEEGTKIRFFNPETDVVETPAIINSELFNKVQTAITNRKTRSSAKEARNAKPKLLKGLVLCGRCGKVYTNTGRMYTCTSGTNEYSERCGSTSVATASLDSAVWNVTKEIFSEAMAKELAAQKSEPIAAEIARLKEEIEGYNEVISNLKKQVGNLLRIASKADDVADDIIEKINILKKEQQMAKAEIADREAKIALLQKRLDAPAEMTEITDEDEKFEYLHKVIEAVFVYGEHKHKILAIQYLNGITAYCIRLWKDWYWFLDRGELVISDAVALQKNSPVDLKINDSILIEVTDSNSAYYSGEDTDVEIYGRYTTEAFFAAMMKNKQLKPVAGMKKDK